MAIHRKKITIRSGLFFSFSLLFSALLLLSYAYVFMTLFENKSSEIRQQQLQSSGLISSNMDDKVLALDTVVQNLRNAPDVKSTFEKYISLVYTGEEEDTRIDAAYRDCLQIIQQVAGVAYGRYQINLYGLRGHSIGTGLYDHRSFSYISTIPVFLYTLQAAGDYYVSVPHAMQWLDTVGHSDEPMISVSRSFAGADGKTIGIIEVMARCSEVFATMDDFGEQSELYVFSALDQCIFPTLTDPEQSTYYYREIVLHKVDADQTFTCPVFDGSENMIVVSKKSDVTGFTVIMLRPEALAFSSLSEVYYLIPVVLITLLATLMMSYWLSGRLTGPLHDLIKAVRQVSVDDFDGRLHLPGIPQKAYFAETEELTQAFSSMSDKLNASINEVLTSRQEELNSRILAFQAQMNPHFLYNNFANISAMASCGMNEQIIRLCENLSGMMRYISRENRTGVPLRDELEYAKQYCLCISLRYGENLRFAWDVDADMLDQPVPKMVIQTLIENAVKHGLSTEPPWDIHIRCWHEDHRWFISVSDSGLGFDPEKLTPLMEAVESFKASHRIPELQIDGMGLLNIYIRLYLLNGESTVFSVTNDGDRGCTVTIGGTLSE